jgi:hypothetical protein
LYLLADVGWGGIQKEVEEEVDMTGKKDLTGINGIRKYVRKENSITFIPVTR